jgi:hypothetical protein
MRSGRLQIATLHSPNRILINAIKSDRRYEKVLLLVVARVLNLARAIRRV